MASDLNMHLSWTKHLHRVENKVRLESSTLNLRAISGENILICIGTLFSKANNTYAHVTNDVIFEVANNDVINFKSFMFIYFDHVNGSHSRIFRTFVKMCFSAALLRMCCERNTSTCITAHGWCQTDTHLHGTIISLIF